MAFDDIRLGTHRPHFRGQAEALSPTSQNWWNAEAEFSGMPLASGESLPPGQQVREPYVAPVRTHARSSASNVRAWRDMSQWRRDEITRDGYAQACRLDPAIWRSLVREDGRPTARGQMLLDWEAERDLQTIAPSTNDGGHPPTEDR